jgi:hypothetical protein
MRLLLAIACTLAPLLSVATARAQAGAYIAFTGADLDTTQTNENAPFTAPPTFTTTTTATRIYGATFGLYGELPIPVIKIGGDVRGELLNGSGSQHYNGVIGPRIAVDLPAVKLKPYTEFLIGIGSYNTLLSTRTDLHVDIEYVVGVDRKLLPFLDWRVLEYSHGNYYTGSIPTNALTTGAVFYIP